MENRIRTGQPNEYSRYDLSLVKKAVSISDRKIAVECLFDRQRYRFTELFNSSLHFDPDYDNYPLGYSIDVIGTLEYIQGFNNPIYYVFAEKVGPSIHLVWIDSKGRPVSNKLENKFNRLMTSIEKQLEPRKMLTGDVLFVNQEKILGKIDHYRSIPNYSTMYTLTAKAALLDANKGDTIDCGALKGKRYSFQRVSDKQGNFISASLSPQEGKNIYNIFGILGKTDIQTLEEETIYVCIEIIDDCGVLFFIDKNGRVSNENEEHDYSRSISAILSKYLPNLINIQDESISAKEADTLFYKQNNCLKKLSECNPGNMDLSEIYEEVIHIGERILHVNYHYEHESGVLINMSSAELIMYHFSGSTSIEDSHLTQAANYAELGLNADKTNQMARLMCIMSNAYLLDFKKALSYVDMLSIKNTVQLGKLVEGLEILQNQLSFQKEVGAYHDIICDFLFKLVSTLKPNIYAYLFAALQSAQILFMLFGDAVSAYAILTGAMDKCPRNKAEPLKINLYNLMCMVCYSLEKYNKVIEYGELAQQYFDASDVQTQANIQCFYGTALVATGNESGKDLCYQSVKTKPCDTTYYMYSRCLYKLHNYDEALVWAKKALFLHQDELNYTMVADIMYEQQNYEDAIEYYKKGLKFLIDSSPNHRFMDKEDIERISVTSQTTINTCYHDLLSHIINLYIRQGDNTNAKVYLEIAKDVLPDHSDWSFLENTIETINITRDEVDRVKQELVEAKQKAATQMQLSKELVMRLIKVQDSSSNYDLDNINDWQLFENKINSIIVELEAKAAENQHLMDEINKRLSSEYQHLNGKALHFLTTAEVLYIMNKDSEIDFACIVLEYCKVLELQLRIALSDWISKDTKMLGQIIGLITDFNISPYSKKLSQLNAINVLRKDSAHTGALSLKAVEKLRTIYYKEGLLSFLEKNA